MNVTQLNPRESALET